ncbi:hypothetical protein KFZ70_03355 [Tamlana fucoidanivorans]|uniref:YtkA-like domain-containing protein n=1 Tax=Allotamlana fucoidanivorans TaxID=2583814 RepID=A0A5C4SL14_9FLAO|nr:hypothetical protein [Tamlana fucoidanivorans]TNJ44268.1 hypothetical protein FGF67_09565 [Tamlana fucoidanivorans]
MKLKYILPIICIVILSMSCSTDDDDTPQTIDEIAELKKIQDITTNEHTIELYSKSGVFKTGYNEVFIRIKNNTEQSYFENANIAWTPMMQMPSMLHSSPHSTISKVSNKKTLYTGSVVYQMTNTDGSGWSLTLNYSINGMEYSATETINVMQSAKQNVTSFMGSDDTRYIIALIEPLDPSIGINDITVGLYKMESMMSFPVVENYTIMLDPRMPGMGNHSSPNNTDLSFNSSDTMYHGDLSLTMTGYWVLNLKLLNTSDTVLKGEDVTESNEKSSLYLELEF